MNEQIMPRTPTVSVMMPTYNVEKYVAQAIHSVLNQTYQDWELIIVDDGSTDETPKILAEYTQKDARIRVHYMEHGGRGKARNQCLELSNGKYIAVCDSDDISLPERFEKQVQFLELNSKISVVGSQLCSFWTKAVLDKSKVISWPSSPDEISSAFHRNKMKMPNCAAMIRASLFQKYGGFDEELIRAQDYAFFKKLSMQGIKFVNLSEVLVFYRQQNPIPSLKYFLESETYRHYADYRINGGKASFNDFNKNLSIKFFREYLKIKYIWFASSKQLNHHLPLRKKHS